MKAIKFRRYNLSPDPAPPTPSIREEGRSGRPCRHARRSPVGVYLTRKASLDPNATVCEMVDCTRMINLGESPLVSWRGA
jgi:hypothetical protein